MVFISDEKKNQILTSSDIVAIISEYVDLKKAGNSYKGLCPFHHEKTPSFTVDSRKQLFHCFGCGAGGDVVSFIMQKEGLDYIEAMKYLADKASIKLDDKRNFKDNSKLNALYDINKDIMFFFYKNLLTSKRAQQYLLKRGLKSSLVNTFMLGYAKDSWDDLYSYVKQKGYLLDDLEKLGLLKKNQRGEYYDKYRDRIIFPIINHYGKIIGFGGRAIENVMPKYLNSPENEIFKKRFNLYGLNLFKKNHSKDVILVEGYMDVIGLFNQTIEIAVASLGTALTKEQALLLKRYADNIYICYDSDQAGQKATDRAIEIFLKEDIKPKIITLSEGLDPDEYVKKYGKEGFYQKIDQALDVYNYKYNKILDIYSESKDNEKYDKINLFIEFLASIKSDLTREIFINNVHKLFDIDKSTLKEAVLKYNNIHENKKEEKNFYKKNKPIVEERKYPDISINELEVLRLFQNQREDYNQREEFFKDFLENEKLIRLKKHLEENPLSEEIYESFDDSYRYIIDYIKNDTDKIVVEELVDKINLENKVKLLKKLRLKNK